MSIQRLSYYAIGLALIAIIASGYTLYSLQTLQAAGSRGEPQTREFVLLAVEYKGTAGADEKIPEGTQASAYAFDPSLVTVNRGDKVVLKIYGINGLDHPTSIQGYKFSFTIFKLGIRDNKIPIHQTQVLEPVLQKSDVYSFNVWRGHLTVVEFVADETGTFLISCNTHKPTMIGYLVVVG